jgi:CDP-4-dehydro-6-deoxyglucose reductase
VGHRVTLAGSGRVFQVQGRESVLDAAIRAGLDLDYGCNTGTCGRCRARLLSGQVEALRRPDYRFSAVERAQGHVLLCSVTPRSDVVIELPGLASTGIEPQRYTVKVRHVQRLAEDLVLFRVALPRSQRMRFHPGQSVRFGAGPTLAIASCPCDARHLEFHLRCGTRGAGEAFCERLRVGRTLELEGPHGARVVDEAASHGLLFIAYDTGFAPVKSLIEHVTAQEHERPVCLAWFTCSTQGPYLHNLCRSWQDAFDAFRYVPVALPSSRAEGDPYAAELDRIVAGCEAPRCWQVYAAVPREMAATTRRVLRARGFGRLGVRIGTPGAVPAAICLRGAGN